MGDSGRLEQLRRDAEAALVEPDGEPRQARLFLAACELAGSDDEVAIGEGRGLMQLAADEGSAPAAFAVGLMMLAGRGGPVDRTGGLGYLERAAAAALSAAAVALGGLLLLEPERAAEGLDWLRRAAVAGDEQAYWLLGSAHLRGLGVAADPVRARMLYGVAAERGVVSAQLELARLFDDGVGGRRDAEAAARWEQAAADAGSAEGCLRLGIRHGARPGSLAQAVAWLMRAAELGSAEAAARLARLYRAGGELQAAPDEASRWHQRAHALGWEWDVDSNA